MLAEPGKGEKAEKEQTIYRAVDLQKENINSEIAAMAKEIISSYVKAEIEKNSKEVLGIYEWTDRVLADLASKNLIGMVPTEPTDREERMSIRLKKQREIFGIEEDPNDVVLTKVELFPDSNKSADAPEEIVIHAN